MALSREEEQTRLRRQRLVKGLVLGGAAVGVPALLNSVVAKKARELPDATWGSRDHYAWRHGDIAYQHLGRSGSKGHTPLVLLHSFGPGHSSAEWRRAAQQLEPSFEVYAPDLPGWGQSGGNFDAPFEPSLYIAFLRDFLSDVVERPAVVVAAGLPAAYAIQVAADHPELVRALALVVPLGLEAYAREPELRDSILLALLRLPVLGTAALNLYTSRSSIAAYLRSEVFASADLVSDSLIDLHYTNSHRQASQRALAANLANFLNHDIHRHLARLEQPVWIAWGRKAVGPDVESADVWLLRRPGAELEIFEHAGILPHAESPGEFGRKLERFLDDQLASNPSSASE